MKVVVDNSAAAIAKALLLIGGFSVQYYDLMVQDW